MLSAQQPVIVRGTVTEQPGNSPVGAATVTTKAGTVGTQTNDAGQFTLRVRTLNDTLVVSRIGYEQVRVPIAGRSELAVTLTRAPLTLSSVVVVGYGTQKRSDVTGSVASVSASNWVSNSVSVSCWSIAS